MNEQGGLGSHLTANKMAHYSDDGTTQLENPLMFFITRPIPRGKFILKQANYQKAATHYY